MNAREAGQIEEAAAHERIRSYDRVKRTLGYHVRKLNLRAKKYARSEKDEERYLRCLKVLAYLTQVYTGAQKARSEEEMDLVDECLEEFNRIKSEYERLRRLEAEYLRVTAEARDRWLEARSSKKERPTIP